MEFSLANIGNTQQVSTMSWPGVVSSRSGKTKPELGRPGGFVSVAGHVLAGL